MSFKDLGFSPDILKSIEECGYDQPTPIQEKAIPYILMSRDVLGLAQTGTGKTASFTLPMIEILAGGRAKARMPRSLILEPTRELAAQVGENFDTYGKYSKLSHALLVGGSSMDEQIKKLDRGVDVLIATPGRLLDLFERGRILLNDIKILVIDEADRMMDMGFIPDIEKIISRLPPMRQTLLFSATMPGEIKKLSGKFLSNPKEVSVAPAASPGEKVQQFLVWCSAQAKSQELAKIINTESVDNAFVFCNRKKDISGLTRYLTQKGFNAQSLHGDMPQSLRTQTLQEFKDNKITLLICSDVAARGIDIKGVSHVFNYDVPINAEDYVHRIGRTGRAGQEGRAWMLASSEEKKYVEAIEDLMKTSIKNMSSSNSGTEDKEGEAGSGFKSKSSHSNNKNTHNTSRKNNKYSKKARSDLPEKNNTQQKKLSNETSVSVGFGDDIPDFLK